MRLTTSCLTLFLAFSLGTGSLFAAIDAKTEITSRRDIRQNEELREDFNVQGEYIAKMDQFKIGLQMIADGDGKFRVVAYPGGLPGDGWKAGEPRMLGTAELKDNVLDFKMTEGRGESKDGHEIKMPENVECKAKLIIERPQGERRGPIVKIDVPLGDKNPALLFEKQYRTSPTLGQEPPAGAKVLFDGSNVDQFKADAKINELPFGNGRFNTLWAEATTKPLENKPYKLHIEFMNSYMPKAHGQARSNSGVYIAENYECQVLDSFGLEGENNECGGFYQVAKPLVNMCFPPLTWQTYDFDFTPPKFEGDKKVENARITVKHNGVVIHDNVELPKETPGRLKEGPEPKGLYLQGHGNKAQYKNIWIKYAD